MDDGVVAVAVIGEHSECSGASNLRRSMARTVEIGRLCCLGKEEEEDESDVDGVAAVDVEDDVEGSRHATRAAASTVVTWDGFLANSRWANASVTSANDTGSWMMLCLSCMMVSTASSTNA